MKIISTSMVKNEADIIESFVRYNCNIYDGMLILDNGSTDNTLKILKLLKDEGLPVFIFEDNDREFHDVKKRNGMLLKAINDFNADIVVPLDADEFLASKKGNPRKILENIEPDTFYLVKWKTYVPDFSENENNGFIPSKITHTRDDNLEEFYKVIVPKKIVAKFNARMNMGCHDLIYDDKYKDKIKRVYNTDLFLAHFPVRSKEQLYSKVTVGWIYTQSNPERLKNQGYHWREIFNKFKENEKIENEDAVNFAKKYALKNVETEINLKKDPIDISFCKNIEIKYTHDEVKPLKNLLESCDWLSKAHLDLKKEFAVEKQRLKEVIEDFQRENNKYQEKKAENKRLQIKIKEYENSISWKITSPFRKIGKIIHNLFN